MSNQDIMDGRSQLATKMADAEMERLGFSWDSRVAGSLCAYLGINSPKEMPMEWHKGVLLFYPEAEVPRTAELFHALQIGAAVSREIREGMVQNV